MRRGVVAGFAAIFCFFGLVSAAAARLTLSRSELSVLRAVNATRVAYHLARLHVDPALVRAARSHTAEMVQADVFAHGAFATRMQSFHIRGPVTGENLAWAAGAYASAQSMIRMWLESPGHRANLLRPGFRRIGIGAFVGSFQGASPATVVTADFAGR